ncbi:MAG TPA: BTAD domain-containing putative transcriptional regulator [Acidimicrobiales bacterium]|nr:BTAD domain-containing putative transcriptional regulator [Acidimicrobiales bacterium]
MEFRILGSLEAYCDGEPVDLGRRKQRALLALLLLDADRVLSASALMDLLWEGHPPDEAPRALRVQVSRLRKALGASQSSDAGDGPEIVTEGPGYRLRLGRCRLESVDFAAMVKEGRDALAAGRSTEAIETLQSGLRLWRGHALAEFAFAAAHPKVARLEELRMVAVEGVLDARMALGNHAELLGELDDLVAEHPLRESLWAKRMVALYRSGRQAEALRAYQDLRRILRDEAGIDPSPELQRLEAAILQQQTALEGEGAPTRAPAAGVTPTTTTTTTTAGGPGNLPVPLTSFVGRTAEREELLERLSTTRLLTLTGVGGCGKTRLALDAAGALDPPPPDGAWLVGLSPVGDPGRVVAAVASVFGAREEPGTSLLDTLIATLVPRRTVVVLDNCEHVLTACGELVFALLRRCEGLQIIATSREPLGVPGEACWPVPPLSLPQPTASFADVEKSEAVQLFLERAALAQVRFTLTPDNAAPVASVCRALDGLPLAIELAATRLSVLSVEQIRDHLHDRFRLLTSGSPTLPARQRTLLAALEWSHDLLSPAEKALLRRLAVFAGGCGLDAVVEVCSGGDVQGDEIVELLAGLVSKSLVVADTLGAQARYRLLETVRHFARERLIEAGEHSDARSRHTRWAIRLAEEAEPELTGPSQRAWLARLATEEDNLRSALEWSLAEGQTTSTLRLAASLTLHWRIHGSFSEGLRWLEEALAVGVDQDPLLRARATWGAGFLALMLDDENRAVPYLRESLALFEAQGHTSGRARALLLLGNCVLFGDTAQALTLLGQSAQLARDAGDHWCSCHALALIGLGQLRRGDTARARVPLEEAVSIGRAHGDPQGLRAALTVSGQLALETGDFLAAESALMEALVLARELSESYAIGAALYALGEVARGLGDHERAHEFLVESLDLARRFGAPSDVASRLCALGDLALQEDDHRRAFSIFAEAAALNTDAGRVVSAPLLGLGRVAALRGDKPGARGLLEDALTVAQASKDWRSTAEVLFVLGDFSLEAADDVGSAGFHREALNIRARLGDVAGVVDSLEAVGVVEARAGRFESTARLFAAAEALRAARGLARPPALRARFEAESATALTAMGPSVYRAAWDEGASMSPEQAVDLALGVPPQR